MTNSVRQFLTDERGQDLVEYSLLLVLLGGLALVYLSAIGASVASVFSKLGNRLADAGSSLP